VLHITGDLADHIAVDSTEMESMRFYGAGSEGSSLEDGNQTRSAAAQSEAKLRAALLPHASLCSHWWMR
jgi:hypothetical protein